MFKITTIRKKWWGDLTLKLYYLLSHAYIFLLFFLSQFYSISNWRVRCNNIMISSPSQYDNFFSPRISVHPPLNSRPGKFAALNSQRFLQPSEPLNVRKGELRGWNLRNSNWSSTVPALQRIRDGFIGNSVCWKRTGRIVTEDSTATPRTTQQFCKSYIVPFLNMVWNFETFQ